MEQLMSEIRAYCDLFGDVGPSTVVQRAAGLNGRTWMKWEAGGGCGMHTAEKIRLYMAENPPPRCHKNSVGFAVVGRYCVKIHTDGLARLFPATTGNEVSHAG